MVLCGWRLLAQGFLGLCREHLAPTSPTAALSAASDLRKQAVGAALEAGALDAGVGHGASPAAVSFLRIFIIWAISSWFRRGPSPQDQSGPGGAPRVASRNLFPKDTLMVMRGGKSLEGLGA